MPSAVSPFHSPRLLWARGKVCPSALRVGGQRWRRLRFEPPLVEPFTKFYSVLDPWSHPNTKLQTPRSLVPRRPCEPIVRGLGFPTAPKILSWYPYPLPSPDSFVGSKLGALSEILKVGESITIRWTVSSCCPCMALRFSFESSNHSFHNLDVSSILALHALIQYQRILCVTPVAAQHAPKPYSLLIITQWAIALQKDAPAKFLSPLRLASPFLFSLVSL